MACYKSTNADYLLTYLLTYYIQSVCTALYSMCELLYHTRSAMSLTLT